MVALKEGQKVQLSGVTKSLRGREKARAVSSELGNAAIILETKVL